MRNKKVNYIKLIMKVCYYYITKNKVSVQDIGHSYNKISPTYQSLYLSAMQTYNDQMLSHLTKKVPQGKLLDLAGGSGYNSLFLKNLRPSYEIDLVDISPEMLQLCDNKAINKTCSSMSQFMNAHCANDYDAIICTWALMYENPHLILKECHRLLKKGGYLYILVNSKKTLPEIRRTYPKLLMKYVNEVTTLMMDLPNPKDASMLKKWGEKENLTCIFSEDALHQFTFDSWQEATTFVTSTGALAGYDKMIDLTKQDVLNDLAVLLKENGDTPTISHYFVKMIFQK